MSRDGLPRAYLRMDPNLDQHADPLTMLRLMCAGARQPERGRFKDRAIIDWAVGRTKVSRAISRGDLSQAKDGSLYLQGWDEWQEGDWTVAERMRRMRAGRASRRDGHVTVPASHLRNDVTTDAITTDSSSSFAGDGGVRSDSPPPPAERGPGRRAEGTSLRQRGEQPRANGENPRANGTSPRQEREAEKRGPTRLGEIIAGIGARADQPVDRDPEDFL